ncbi:lysylphosphatidylglycerol synthase transmembrane domain-containing protein [Halorhabdus salina]|uniref:lysylphosphatidylglycerol synthase transmembrane domain-containing protein n=1 Tax=Halorhabdus salina TaxID=2750670 RepID=UPI0015EFD549|nr:lysylphosphatidylglycerol synthase transmembrane domain-containing protein [Halorhabdus salina]
MSERRQRLVTAARYAIGLAVLAWLVSQTDWGRIVRTFGRIEPLVVLAILGLSIVGLLARFWTWHVLLNRLTRTPFRVAAGTTLSVAFVNHLSPTQAVGRSLAPAVLRQYTGQSWGPLVAVAALHTALYAMLYGLVATLGLVVFGMRMEPWLLFALAASAGVYLVVGLTVIVAGTRLDGVGALASTIERRIPTHRIPLAGGAIERFLGALPDLSAEAAETFSTLLGSPRTPVTYASGWVIALMVVPGARSWLLLDAVGEPFTPAILLPLALVTAYAVTFVPVTPGGVGVAEASGTLVLAALGVPPAVGAPTILIDRFLGVYLPALAGWYPTIQLDLSRTSDE